jgi:hypothetical protein
MSRKHFNYFDDSDALAIHGAAMISFFGTGFLVPSVKRYTVFSDYDLASSH